jgi:NADH-quinone oxidoreductase subunit M
LIAALASLGLPGLSNFPGEFLVILSAFLARGWVYALLAASGVVLAAVYVLWLYGESMQGPTQKPEVRSMQDLSAREILVLAPVAIFIVLLGVFPGPVLSRTSASAANLVRIVRSKPQAAAVHREASKTIKITPGGGRP